MIAAKTILGNHEILIETVEESVQVAGDASGRQTAPTGIEDNFKESYSRAKNIIISMAETALHKWCIATFRTLSS
jgi:hypothetical protein